MSAPAVENSTLGVAYKGHEAVKVALHGIKASIGAIFHGFTETISNVKIRVMLLDGFVEKVFVGERVVTIVVPRAPS